MKKEKGQFLKVEQKKIASSFLEREVVIDLYSPSLYSLTDVSLLLINDGQDLAAMNFKPLLTQLLSHHLIHPLVCVGIHASDKRLHEYGTSGVLDYEGRGKKADAYRQFVVEELLPFVHLYYGIDAFKEKAFAGFSLGGLSALDIVWKHPHIFLVAGVFSGSLWWRSKSLQDDYNDDTDRIMHRLIRNGTYRPGMRFYFTTGSLDETADRNQNGIIDSIDDTVDLIKELQNKGYNTDYDIKYINYEDGRHDVTTWGKAMPQFLLWGWGR